MYRLKTHIIHNKPDEMGFKVEYFPLKPSTNWNVVSLQTQVKDTIYEVDDVNLALLTKAACRSNELIGAAVDKQIRIRAFPRKRVSSESPEIALVPTEANRSQVVGLIQRAIKVKPIHKEERFLVDDDLLLNRDLIKKAIGAGQSTLVEELLDQYLLILKDFLITINPLGLTYNFQRAQQEAGSFSDWAPVSKIQEHFYALFPIALQSPDRDIIDTFTDFPYRVMVEAIRQRDHLLFQRFSKLYGSIFSMMHQIATENNLKKAFVRRCWELPLNCYKYNIRRGMDKPNLEKEEAESLGEYGIYLIKIMIDLMKVIIDIGQYEMFSVAASAARGIGKWIGLSPLLEMEDIELGIRHIQSQEERDRIFLIGEQLNKIQKTRNQGFLGLGGWIIHLYESHKITFEKFQTLISIVDRDDLDMGKLFKTYTAINQEERSLFDWSMWEMNEIPMVAGEVTARPMQYSNWIAKHYVLRALELSPDDLGRVKILEPSVHSRGILETVKNILSEFESDEVWKALPVFRDSKLYIAKRESLLHVHQEVAKRQNNIEQDQLIQQDLDPDKVAAFISEVYEAWEESSTIRNIMKLYEMYEEREAIIPEDIDPLGFRQLEPKGVFADEGGRVYGDWGPGYGRGLAAGEDGMLSMSFSQLSRIQMPFDGFDRSLKATMEQYKIEGSSPVIFISGSKFRSALASSEDFTPEWRASTDLPKIQGLQGVYDGSLIFRVEGIAEDEVVIVDVRKFGKLVQYSPNESNQFPLYVNVEQMTEDRAQELLKKNPKYPTEPVTNTVLQGEDALKWFLSKVRIEITERVRFEDINPDAGMRFVFV